MQQPEIVSCLSLNEEAAWSWIHCNLFHSDWTSSSRDIQILGSENLLNFRTVLYCDSEGKRVDLWKAAVIWVCVHKISWWHPCWRCKTERNHFVLLQTRRTSVLYSQQWKTPSCNWTWRSTTWCEMGQPTTAAAAYFLRNSSSILWQVSLTLTYMHSLWIDSSRACSVPAHADRASSLRRPWVTPLTFLACGGWQGPWPSTSYLTSCHALLGPAVPVWESHLFTSVLAPSPYLHPSASNRHNFSLLFSLCSICVLSLLFAFFLSLSSLSPRFKNNNFVLK